MLTYKELEGASKMALGQGACCQPDGRGLISRTHMVDRENRLLQVVYELDKLGVAHKHIHIHHAPRERHTGGERDRHTERE